jgi:hypothetical protein
MFSRPYFLRLTLGGLCLLTVATATAVNAHPSHSGGVAAASDGGHRHAAFNSGRRLQLSVPGRVIVYNHAKARVRPRIRHIRARIVSRHFSTKRIGHIRARKHRALQLGPGRYTVEAHVRYRPLIGRSHHLRDHRFGAVRHTTLRRHVRVRWGGYRRRTATQRGVATMHFDTSGPWTLQWVANCRDNFPYFGGVATSDNNVSNFNGHVHGGRNPGHIRVPWSGAVNLHIYDAGCTWRLTELSRHPFRLSR